MVSTPVLAGVAVVVVAVAVAGVVLWLRSIAGEVVVPDAYEDEAEAADGELDRRIDRDLHDYGLAAVVEQPDDTVIPIVEFHLGEDVSSLDRDRAWPLAVEAFEAMQPAFEDCPVAQYEVDFTWGSSILGGGADHRRVAITPEMAERLRSDDDYRSTDLRRDVERTEGSLEPPIAWER